MKNFIILFFFFLLFPLVSEASDPKTICETTTYVLALSSFNHCQKGDLIEVSAYEMKLFCNMDRKIIPVLNEYLCEYRGSKRSSRKRPLTDAEKIVDQESLDNLDEKYSD